MKYFILFIIMSAKLLAADYKFASQDYGPFVYEENKKVTGAMVEIIDAMCAITKDKCTMEIFPLPRAIDLLTQGEIHGIVSVLKTAERDAVGNFVSDIIKSDIIYIAESSRPNIANASELAGYTIGAVKAAASAKLANKDAQAAGGGANVVEDMNNDTVLKKIAAGRYGDKGVAVINEDLAKFLANKNNIKNFKKLFAAKSDNYGVYFSKKSIDDKTLEKFTKALEELKKNGEIKKITTKYNFTY